MGIQIASHFGAGTCTAATLNAALTAIGSASTTLVVPPVPRNSVTPCTWVINSTVTVPATLSLDIPRGTILQVAPGVTLTLEAMPRAGLYKVFQADTVTTGTVRLLKGPAWAEWWGAVGDDSTDSAAAIRAALLSKTEGANVRLGEGVFRIGSTITAPTGTTARWSLEGISEEVTILRRASGFTGTLFQIGITPGEIHTSDLGIRRLTIDCIDVAAGTVGIRGYRIGDSVFSEFRVRHCEKGVWLTGGTVLTWRYIEFENNKTGMLIDNTGDISSAVITFSNSRWRNNIAQTPVTDLLIDGAVSTVGLIREITLDNVAFDGGAASAGRVNLDIRDAQRVRVDRSHFEGGEYYVKLSGSGNKPVQFVSFTNCHFGTRNSASAQPVAFVFTGTHSADGLGSYIEGGSFSEGSFSFTQTRPMEMRNSVRLGGDFTGESWRLIFNSGATALSNDYPPTDSSQRISEHNILDHPVANRDMIETWNHQSTVGLSTNALLDFTLGTDRTIYIDAQIVGKEHDGSDQAGYHVACLFDDTANTAALVGTMQSLHPAIESAGATAWDVSCTTSSGNARINTTGATGQNIRWSGYFRILRMFIESP